MIFLERWMGSWIFKKSEIKHYDVPKRAELSIDNNWAAACQIKDFIRYIPDSWVQAKKMERKFFWDICSTLAYEWVEALV